MASALFQPQKYAYKLPSGAIIRAQIFTWRTKLSLATRKPWLETWVDVFTMNLFSYLVALPIELLIAGMSFKEHLQVRLVALLLNTVVARPFGLWRSYLVNKFGVTQNSGWLKTYLVDTLIFLSFQMPLYVGNLILGGADMMEILKATMTVSLIAGTLGRPYGIMLDWMRVRHGLPHTLAQSR